MNDLIRIDYNHENPTVSGRELHAALEVNMDYLHWFEHMCERGFAEGKSYRAILTDRFYGLPVKPRLDHELSIAMAKGLCMLQRSEMGRKLRQYFTAVEEVWNSPDKVIERALQIAHRRIVDAERRILALTEENEAIKSALNTSLRFYSVETFNKTFNKGWTRIQCQAIGRRLTAYCRARAIEIRSCETNDERFGTVNSYPLTAWESFLREAM